MKPLNLFCPSRPPVDCIINDNHDYLLEFLEGLALPEHSATIQDWDTAGRVYLDYIRVIKTLQDIQQVRTLSASKRFQTWNILFAFV